MFLIKYQYFMSSQVSHELVDFNNRSHKHINNAIPRQVSHELVDFNQAIQLMKSAVGWSSFS